MTRRHAVLTACFSTVFISYAVRYGYGILLPKMLPTLEISKTEAGAIYSSFFIAYTVASPVLGLLGGRGWTGVYHAGRRAARAALARNSVARRRRRSHAATRCPGARRGT